MKDLGYKRTPTDAKLRVTMPDGTRYDVPVQAIVDNRDMSYSSGKEDTVGFIRNKSLSAYSVTGWAANNMHWSDVEKLAVRVDEPLPPTDFQEGWVNGEKEIVGEL